jgi:hypothetical protein
MFKSIIIAAFAATALAAEDQFRPVGWGRPAPFAPRPFGPPPVAFGPPVAYGPPGPPFGVDPGLGGYCQSLDIPSNRLPP